MIKNTFLFLFLALTLKTSAQTVFENSLFGFKFEKPENWIFYGGTEFDYERNQCVYTFHAPPISNEGLESDNSISVVARADGYVQSVRDVYLLELQRLHREFDDLIVVLESDSSLIVQYTIQEIPYMMVVYVNYQHEISYLLNYSYPSNQDYFMRDEALNFFRSIEYYPSTKNFSDIDALISKDPEDASLYFSRASLKFCFHEFEASMSDINQALDILPFYGEAYYLRGYLHISLGDTVEACRDFESSANETYLGDMELIDYCNTPRILEALESSSEENNLFWDFDPNANHIEYVDSIKKHEFIILSIIGEPSEQVITYMNQMNHFFMLEYEQLDSIFQTETGILKLYSFGILCRKFPKQINKGHKKIFKNENEIMVLKRDQNDLQSIPIKEVASMMYKSIKALEEEKEKELKTEKAVKKFVKNYSKYPKSYESLSFEQFHEMHTANGENLTKEKNSEVYVIGHRYRIKDVNGELVESFNTFKFSYEFKINIIEEEEGNTFSAYPPRVQEWLDKYGKSMKDKDKKKLGIN